MVRLNVAAVHITWPQCDTSAMLVTGNATSKQLTDAVSRTKLMWGCTAVKDDPLATPRGCQRSHSGVKMARLGQSLTTREIPGGRKQSRSRQLHPGPES